MGTARMCLLDQISISQTRRHNDAENTNDSTHEACSHSQLAEGITYMRTRYEERTRQPESSNPPRLLAFLVPEIWYRTGVRQKLLRARRL